MQPQSTLLSDFRQRYHISIRRQESTLRTQQKRQAFIDLYAPESHPTTSTLIHLSNQITSGKVTPSNRDFVYKELVEALQSEVGGIQECMLGLVGYFVERWGEGVGKGEVGRVLEIIVLLTYHMEVPIRSQELLGIAMESMGIVELRSNGILLALNLSSFDDPHTISALKSPEFFDYLLLIVDNAKGKETPLTQDEQVSLMTLYKNLVLDKVVPAPSLIIQYITIPSLLIGEHPSQQLESQAIIVMKSLVSLEREVVKNDSFCLILTSLISHNIKRMGSVSEGKHYNLHPFISLLALIIKREQSKLINQHLSPDLIPHLRDCIPRLTKTQGKIHLLSLFIELQAFASTNPGSQTSKRISAGMKEIVIVYCKCYLEETRAEVKRCILELVRGSDMETMVGNQEFVDMMTSFDERIEGAQVQMGYVKVVKEVIRSVGEDGSGGVGEMMSGICWVLGRMCEQENRDSYLAQEAEETLNYLQYMLNTRQFEPY